MPNTPQFNYPPQPPKDFKSTMDYKNAQIKKFADDKQESMRIFSSGRDAVLIATTFYSHVMDEEQIKEKILMWRKWFYTEIYGDNEEFYKENNLPF